MPPKAKIAAPIDRPLSKAYVREFTGWSTAEPPGISDPTSLRIMENVQINRDGSARIRPGLRYLSYATPPTDIATAKEVLISFEAAGWRYKQVAQTDAVDYSGPALDDSTWALGAAAFGGGAGIDGGPFPSRTTNWEIYTDLWIRKDVTTPTGVPLVVTTRTEAAEIYWDGVLMGVSGDRHTDSPIAEREVIIPAQASSQHTLAVRLRDDKVTKSGGTYGDAELSYTIGGIGIAPDRPFVGTHEPFYLNDGTKAYLCAVREVDLTVGFRVLVLNENASTMYLLDDAVPDFSIPQGVEVLNFSEGTTYVTYLQIDNKIFALSDNGENMRVFTVGESKAAKALESIERPDWTNDDKLSVVHPDAGWIAGGEPSSVRRNRVPNPSFEENANFWNAGKMTQVRRPADLAITPVSGNRALRIGSKPTRTNLATQPLHDVASTGIVGWNEGGGDDTVEADGAWLKLVIPAKKGSYQCKSRLLPGFDPRTTYRVAFDVELGQHVDPYCIIRFYGVNGAPLGEARRFAVEEINEAGRWVSGRVTSPRGTVSARVFPGADNTRADATSIRIKNVMIFEAGEGHSMFHGGSGANYFWVGAVNASASVYHPPADILLTTDRTPANPGKPYSSSVYLEADSAPRAATLTLRILNKNGELLESFNSGPVADVVGAPTRLDAGSAGIHAKGTQAAIWLALSNVPRGEYHWVDAAMLEPGVAVPGTYFDGSTPDVPTAHNRWMREKHASGSVQEIYAAGAAVPDPETRTAETLIATGGPSVNVHQFAFFYTFENEVGESAASKVTVRRAQRAWADWLWETPDPATGDPSGTETDNPNLAADQLVAILPQDVYDSAVAQGAIRWNLYMATWSDQEPAPVTATLVGSRELPEDGIYDERGWIRVTPQMSDASDLAVLPTEDNRYNYSDPSRGGTGLVASDRMILVNDPTDAAVIRWSSNKLGEYTNFTASKGGGYKTLTSGNLYVPAAVKLWQNPQSADTICILCLGTDGHSVSYYMAPAQVASQSEALNVMGFEETTGTPGTTSPYGVEIFNNSLYHPLDDQLMKSTASNYNINHKSQTDMIRNMWEKLANKYWIISAQHDNRLYYIVTNPEGDEVEEGCKGNEVWVFDAAAKTGTWSRLKIQAHSLRKLEFGDKVYMSIIRPEGIYYLDPEYGMDDVVDPETLIVSPTAIPWKLESNTQGANRAHDAWCHLQQLQVSLGYFQGRMRYGIRSVDINGRSVDMHKIVKDTNPPTLLAFDIEDSLRIARDLKEWFFYAESLEDSNGVVEPSYGQLNMVQFRYTPVSVNVGYDHGSVETFEYGRDVALAPSTTTENGIPLPLTDSRRP